MFFYTTHLISWLIFCSKLHKKNYSIRTVKGPVRSGPDLKDRSFGTGPDRTNHHLKVFLKRKKKKKKFFFLVNNIDIDRRMIRFHPNPIRHPIRHPIHSDIYLNYPTDDGYPYLKRITGWRIGTLWTLQWETKSYDRFIFRTTKTCYTDRQNYEGRK